MTRQYFGGDLPDYYIVDSDSHIDETKIIDPTLILARALIRDVAPEKLAIIKEVS